MVDIKEEYPRQLGFFQKALESERLSHAYIFYGPKGEKKKDFAKYLSQYFQCQERKGDSPCGKCHHCRLASSGTFVDTHMIDKGDEHILIDDIREAQRGINLSRSKGEWKFLIINNAEKLTNEACEALLKTLEEPPAKSIIILTAGDKSGMPKTILSRAQSVYFYEDFSATDGEEGGNAIAICRDLLSEKDFLKLIRAKELAEKEEPQKDIDMMIWVLRNLALNTQGIGELGDFEKDSWGDLEKSLPYGRIAKVL